MKLIKREEGDSAVTYSFDNNLSVTMYKEMRCLIWLCRCEGGSFGIEYEEIKDCTNVPEHLGSTGVVPQWEGVFKKLNHFMDKGEITASVHKCDGLWRCSLVISPAVFYVAHV